MVGIIILYLSVSAEDVLELFFSHDTETNLEVFTENKKKFQRYMQDIAHQNKVSRKRALIKANEQGMLYVMSAYCVCHSHIIIVIMIILFKYKAADDSKKLEDALQENEKLKAKVANSEENIFKLSEEKEQAEERYLKIIKGSSIFVLCILII